MNNSSHSHLPWCRPSEPWVRRVFQIQSAMRANDLTKVPLLRDGFASGTRKCQFQAMQSRSRLRSPTSVVGALRNRIPLPVCRGPSPDPLRVPHAATGSSGYPSAPGGRPGDIQPPARTTPAGLDNFRMCWRLAASVPLRRLHPGSGRVARPCQPASHRPRTCPGTFPASLKVPVPPTSSTTTLVPPTTTATSVEPARSPAVAFTTETATGSRTAGESGTEYVFCAVGVCPTDPIDISARGVHRSRRCHQQACAGSEFWPSRVAIERGNGRTPPRSSTGDSPYKTGGLHRCVRHESAGGCKRENSCCRCLCNS